MPATAPKPEKKKAAAKKVDPEILKQRRETIEKRILRLEGKLNKDRALLVQYADTSDSDVITTAEERAAV